MGVCEKKLNPKTWETLGLKGMFGLPRFALILLFMKSKGANFA